MSDNIPSGVITEILGRLSWCQLCRVRCVCKEWRSIIDEPGFIQRQLQRSTSLFLHQETAGHERYTSRGLKLGSFCPDRREEAPLASSSSSPCNLTTSSFLQCHEHFGVMGSCHGLVCLGDFKTRLLLVNPVLPEEKRFVTLKRFLMWDSDDDDDYGNYMPYSSEWAGYGFGYDEVAHDYKAVVLLADSCSLVATKSDILTYRFRTRSFSLCPLSYDLRRSAIKDQRMGVLVGGSLHWILEPNVIHSYDLGSDVFGEIQQPKYAAQLSSSSAGVGVVDSCLSVCATYAEGSAVGGGNKLDVWVMKEYGNEDSWCILHSVVDNPVFDQPPQVVRCLGMLDGQILMLVNGSGLTWVDPRNGRVEVVPIPGFTNASKFEAVLCLESQVKTFPAEDYETRDDDIRTETSEAESSEE